MAESAGASQLLAHIAIVAVPILAAIVLHEVAHGAVAYVCGDSTAARAGRLTLNPLPHIDPIGTVILPASLLLAAFVLRTPPFIFGYARPVPVDVRQLHHPRRDAILVALAGPGTNLALAAVSTGVLAALMTIDEPPLPVQALREMALASVSINCVLAVFNLLPVPPLDGGRVLTGLLPAGAARALARVEGLGFILVLLLMMNSNVLSQLVRPVIAFFLGFVR